MFLCLSSCVGRIPFGIQATLVTDADTVGIVVFGMGTNHLFGATGVDSAVFGYIIVVADGLETTSLVAGFKVFNGEITVDSGGRAVDDDKVDFPHDFLVIFFWKIFFVYFCTQIEILISHRFHRRHRYIICYSILCFFDGVFTQILDLTVFLKSYIYDRQ